MSLAAKYRPRRFRQVVGQQSVVSQLQGLLSKKAPPAAILFSGPHSAGKTTLARLVAQRLGCSEPTPKGESCGKCRSCLALAEGQNPDIAEYDCASSRGIDFARQLAQTARCAPTFQHRTFILDEAHQLTKEAFNALLKTFEEPSPTTTFILCTTEPDKVIGTIQSRCLKFGLRAISPEDSAALLLSVAEKEGLQLTEKAATKIAVATRGHPRDALMALEKLSGVLDNGLTDDEINKAIGEVITTPSAANMASLVLALLSGNSDAALRAANNMKSPETALEEAMLCFQQVCYKICSPTLCEDWYKPLLDRVVIGDPPEEDEKPQTGKRFNVVQHRLEVRLDHKDLKRVVTALTVFEQAYKESKYSIEPQVALVNATLRVLAGVAR